MADFQARRLSRSHIFLVSAFLASSFATSCTAETTVQNASERTTISAVPAFPGAEGYGAFARGGRGGIVLHVTNLRDKGPGSLRWALEQRDGPRIVVFDVAGSISLESQILITKGQVTIAGQTAPGEGVTVAGSRIRIKASDIIIRGLHFRPGDGPIGQPYGDRDGLMIGTTDFVLHDIVIDHNSFSWAVDENVAINGKVRNISFSNNIVAEGLSRNLHPKGEHSKGLLVSNWDGAEGDTIRISIIKNLFASNMDRNPMVRAGQDIEILNNLVVNYGRALPAISIGGGSSGTLRTSVLVAGNVIETGLSTKGSGVPPIRTEAMAPFSQITLFRNMFRNEIPANQNSLVQHTVSANFLHLAADGGAPAHVQFLDPTVVREHVITHAGTRTYNGRDRVDLRITHEVANGTSVIIDRPPTLQPDAPSDTSSPNILDTDRDGMPDWFERLYSVSPVAVDGRADEDQDGFTNIEEYINGLISGFESVHAPSN